MRANVIGRPSMVTEADAPISCSARGSADAGPAPRQTFTVGTSWRISLQAQRSSGKLRNEPSWKVMVLSGGGGKPCIQPRVSGSVSAAVGVAVGLERVATDMSGLRGMMGSRNMEAPRYAADVPARVTGAAGSCSPHERSDMRERSRYRCAHARHAGYCFASRDAFLAALRADQRARSRFTARTAM